MSEAAGRPFRALALALAGLAGWTAARLPDALARQQVLAARLGASEPVSDVRPIQAAPVSPPPATPAPIYIFPPETPAPVIIYRDAPQPAFSAPYAASVAPPAWPTPEPAPGNLTPPALSQAPSPLLAEDFATAAYDRLRQGQKREALRLFEAALSATATSPDPRAKAWAREAAALRRRWSGQAFALLREAGPDPAAGIATGPVLGASQSGLGIAYTPGPLAQRPLSLTARVNAATDARGRTDPRTVQAAFGVRWQATPALALSAERLVGLGELAVDDWLVRLSGGASRSFQARGIRLTADAYGEASLLGNGDMVAAGQTRLLAPLTESRVALAAGLGSWGSLQTTGAGTIGRLDLGPSAVMRLSQGRFGLEVQADYRQRIAGNAEPGSGPTVTLSTNF
jgi:hypothetical protein